MKIFKAKEYPYKIIRQNPNSSSVPFPILREPNGYITMSCVSPYHGRSFVVGKTDDGRYIVSKGNGLSYSQSSYLHSAEFGDYTWGILLANEAIRDYDMGMQISELGIKTNNMEFALELKTKIRLTNGHEITPVLLQYSVECPYRICDIPYMSNNELKEQIEKWGKKNQCGSSMYLIAADVLISNLNKLHNHNILHNAIHIQNYTWALELLDFELACSPKHPYDNKEDMSRVNDLFNREIIQTYEIINHIAWCLGEDIDYKKIDNLFAHYSFDLSTLVTNTHQ